MRLSGGKPLSFTRRWTQQPRPVLLSLIGLNVAVFVAQLFLEAYEPGFVRDYLAMTEHGARDAYSWQFVTAAFLHQGPWHLSANMLVLYFLGRELELVSMRFKAKYMAYGAIAVVLILICVQRSDAVAHSACLGGLAIGWLYAHLLGFGRPSFLQRFLTRRRAVAERFRRMDAEQFIAEEIDPLLEKISRAGVTSLTRAERRILAQARE